MAEQPDSPISVLLVDDDDIFRKQIETWICSNFDFSWLGGCSTGENGLDILDSKKPVIAVVDFGLPGMNGAEFVWRSKEKLPRLKTIMVSGIPDDFIVFEALDSGVDGFLEKPVQRASFFKELSEVAAGGHSLSKRVSNLLLKKFRESRPNPKVKSLLSEREKEVVELVCLGVNDEAIARKLGIALSTVRWHEKNIHQKLDVHCRAELQLKLLGKL